MTGRAGGLIDLRSCVGWMRENFGLTWTLISAGHWLLNIGIGLIVFNDVSIVVSWIATKASKRRISALAFPLIAPLFIVLGVILLGKPLWLLLAICDAATMLFLPAAKDMWDTSRFTRVQAFSAQLDNQEIQVSLHRGGRYVLRMKRALPRNELGWVGFSFGGLYTTSEDGISLRLGDDIEPKWNLLHDGSGYVLRALQPSGATTIAPFDGSILHPEPHRRAQP